MDKWDKLVYKLNPEPAIAEKWHFKGCMLKVKHKFSVKVISKTAYQFNNMKN